MKILSIIFVISLALVACSKQPDTTSPYYSVFAIKETWDQARSTLLSIDTPWRNLAMTDTIELNRIRAIAPYWVGPLCSTIDSSYKFYERWSFSIR